MTTFKQAIENTAREYGYNAVVRIRADREFQQSAIGFGFRYKAESDTFVVYISTKVKDAPVWAVNDFADEFWAWVGRAIARGVPIDHVPSETMRMYLACKCIRQHRNGAKVYRGPAEAVADRLRTGRTAPKPLIPVGVFRFFFQRVAGVPASWISAAGGAGGRRRHSAPEPVPGTSPSERRRRRSSSS